MHVQQIEVVKLGHFRHARGQRQIVWRIFEQRIAGDFHFVIVNVGMRTGQPDGLGIGDEVNFVAALRQFQPQLGCDHAAAAVGGITGNADFHSCPFRISTRALHIRWRGRSQDSVFDCGSLREEGLSPRPGRFRRSRPLPPCFQPAAAAGPG